MRQLTWLVCALLLGACATQTTPADLPTVVPTFPPPPAAIELNQTINGTLVGAGAYTDYRFTVSAAQAITVQVFSGQVSLTLLNSAGQLVAQGIIQEQTPPAAGEYVLRVAGEPGDYSFAVQARDLPTPTPDVTATPVPVVVAIPTDTPSPLDELGTFIASINSATPTFGAFNTPEERHIYTFQGAAGSYMRLRMQRTSGTVDPLLTLFTPDGTAIATDDNGGGGRTAFINGVLLPADGVYSLLASGEGEPGTYEITLESAPEPYPVTPVVEGSGDIAAPQPTVASVALTPTLETAVTGALLFDHIPFAATIERPGAFDRFSIQVDAGETFTVGVVPQGNLNVRLDMLSPTGAIAEAVERREGDGELVILNYTAEQSDPYTLFVTGIDDTTGDYRVSFGRGSTREEIRQAETVPDRVYSGTIARRAVRDAWFLRLQAGDIVTATLTLPDGTVDFNPVLEFVAPDGTVAFTAPVGVGETAAAIPSVRANTSGLHQLRVRGGTPIQTGGYSLIWRFIEAAPTPTPPLLVADLFAVDDTLPVDEFLYYPLQGNAGERVLVEVIAEPGSGLDAVVSLLNENGETFAEDDDGGGDLNPRLLAQIPADGLYQVRVGSYAGGGGNFVLRVRRVY